MSEYEVVKPTPRPMGRNRVTGSIAEDNRNAQIESAVSSYAAKSNSAINEERYIDEVLREAGLRPLNPSERAAVAARKRDEQRNRA